MKGRVYLARGTTLLFRHNPFSFDQAITRRPIAD